MRRFKQITVPFFLLALVISLSVQSADSLEAPGINKPLPAKQQTMYPHAIPVYSYKIMNTYSHNSRSFTQGLAVDGDIVYEGTGLYGRSSLIRMRLGDGQVMKSIPLPEYLFGEGVTLYRDTIIQLTWKSGRGFVYAKEDLRLINTFHYSREGWGLTCDGESLIMSDGTAHLYFLHPETFKKTKQITVYAHDQKVTNLNELEYVRGDIYANVWRTNKIAIINPDTGRVEAWINLEGLTRSAGGDKTVKTLNGIAYDAETDRLFVTGKLWPKIYEIQVIPGK